jgi:tetratricopeptide (TPR) repeat protein
MRRLSILLLALLDLSACNLLHLKPTPDLFYSVTLKNNPNNQGALFSQGERFLNQNRYDEALPYYQRLTRLAPANAAAWFALGRCQYELRRFGKARAAFHKTMSLKPSEAAALGLAAAALMDGDLAEARRLTQESGQRYGISAALLQVRGDIAYQAGDWTAALGFYRQSLEKTPSQPEIVARVKDLEDYLTSAG